MKAIKGTKNRIIFQAVETEDKSLIISNVDKSVTRGIVIKVTGQDEDLQKPQVKEGDEILLTKGSFVEKFVYKNEEYYQTLESSVIVILN
jgi:co-chaperonin GroES (HSP10)